MSENDNKWLKYDAFRSNLRALIDSKGLMAKDLAAEVDATPATISRYVTQMRDPDLEYVYRIAKYFGVTIDYLLGINDNKHSDLTPEARKIAELYTQASAEDQAVIKTVLRKYEGNRK